MYIVGVGLVKVYKALIRLMSGALSVPLLMSVSEALSFFTVIKLPHKSSEWSSLVPDSEAESSSEIQNPISFTMSYQCGHHHFVSYVCFQFCLFLSGRDSKCIQHPNKSFKRIFCDSSKTTFSSNFPGSPVIATSPSNAGSAHLVSGQGAKIPYAWFNIRSRAPLMAQWWWFSQPMQETWARSLVQENPTCHRATKPVHRNC